MPSCEDRIIDSREIISKLEELSGEYEALCDAVEAARTEYQDAVSDNDDLSDEASEDLQSKLDDAKRDLNEWENDNLDEMNTLKEVNEQGKQCTSDWSHGETLINQDYWEDYTREFASGAIGNNSDWIVIDWEATAENLRADYNEIDYNGSVFYIRES
jgi:regulator of replication initiation timing